MALGAVVTSLLAAAVLYAVVLLRQKRAAFKGLPQPPGHDLIFGHAKVIKELADELPPGLHPACYAYFLREKYNLPKAFYVDLWPFSHSWLLLTDNELFEQITTKPSLSKFEALPEMMRPYAGLRNLVVMEGEEWKRWRGIFNSGFSAANLAKHVPAIVHETEKFMAYLSEKAASGAVFPMEPAAVDLTVEIIGHVILGSAFTSQAGGKSYKDGLRSQIYWTTLGTMPGFAALRALDPYRMYKMWSNESQMNRAIRHIIHQRWDERRQKNGSSNQKAFYAIDLALDAYAADKKAMGQDAAATATIDNEYMTILQDQMKVFIFAGHDTSSGTICYIIWSLFKHPEWLQKLRDEYDRVLGPDTSAAIAARPNVLNELPLTTAVIKETLRIFPPGSTIRGSTTDYPLVDPDSGETYQTKDWMVWAPSFAVMRDSRYFPDPHSFRPERFLPRDQRPDDLTPERAHPHAWRPFEVGPRNCIGQELAMVEIKIAMALMLRRFDVVPAYEQKVDEKFDFVGGPAYQVLFGTAKPNQGMPVRVVERKEGEVR